MSRRKCSGEHRPKLYFASPLSSETERQFNKQLVTKLGLFFDVYLPQEDGGLMVEMIAHGMSSELASHTVFNKDIFALQQCDLLLIVMNGSKVNEGAAFELGFAYSSGKDCYGLQIDNGKYTQNLINPMVYCPLRHIFRSIFEFMDWAQQHVKIPLVGNNSFS